MTEQRRAAAAPEDSTEAAGRQDELAMIVASHQESTVSELLTAGGLRGFTATELLERTPA